MKTTQISNERWINNKVVIWSMARTWRDNVKKTLMWKKEEEKQVVDDLTHLWSTEWENCIEQ